MDTQKRLNGTPVHGKQVRETLCQQSKDKRNGQIYSMGSWTAAEIIRLKGRGACVVRPSFEGMMATSRECYPTTGDSRSKKSWRDRHLCVVGKSAHGYRVYAIVQMVLYGETLHYLMDAKTGTLYRIDTGDCCTSDIERIEHIAIADDIKPFLKANVDRAHVQFQWGNDDPIAHNPAKAKEAEKRRQVFSINKKVKQNG